MVHTIAHGTRVVPAIIVVFPALPVSCLRSVIEECMRNNSHHSVTPTERLHLIPQNNSLPITCRLIVHYLSSQGSNLISAGGGCSAPPPRRHFIWNWNSRYSSFGDLTLDKLGREQKAGCNYTSQIWQ